MTHPVLNLIRRISAIALTALVVASSAAACSLADEDEEVKLGRENALENDKVIKLVTDPTITDRVNRIGQEIAKVANEIEVPAIWGSAAVKKFAYTFKVVDEKDINAYSLPGGFIYINKGTLEFSQSDDEIAGVLAHEVAHASHHHMMKLIKEQNKIQNAMLIPMLIAILGGGGDGAATAMQVGQIYTVAKMNSFGVEAEQDADQAAVHYMRRTSYNPVGVLTFMERLARKERFQPQVELGIYRTPPPPPRARRGAGEGAGRRRHRGEPPRDRPLAGRPIDSCAHGWQGLRRGPARHDAAGAHWRPASRSCRRARPEAGADHQPPP